MPEKQGNQARPGQTHAVKELYLANRNLGNVCKVQDLDHPHHSLGRHRNWFPIKLSQGLVSGGIGNIINLRLFEYWKRT